MADNNLRKLEKSKARLAASFAKLESLLETKLSNKENKIEAFDKEAMTDLNNSIEMIEKILNIPK